MHRAAGSAYGDIEHMVRVRKSAALLDQQTLIYCKRRVKGSPLSTGKDKGKFTVH